MMLVVVELQVDLDLVDEVVGVGVAPVVLRVVVVAALKVQHLNGQLEGNNLQLFASVLLNNYFHGLNLILPQKWINSARNFGCYKFYTE
jgi:hypothetical protein